MKTNHLPFLGLTAGLLALSTLGRAQSPVRDSDNEARNAYQESCVSALGRRENFAFCQLTLLPAGKRLALRYLAATCREVTGTTRNQSLRVAGEINLSDESIGPDFTPQRINGTTETRYRIAEPVFLHADQAPVLSVRWEGEGTLACGFSVFGYLIDKP